MSDDLNAKRYGGDSPQEVIKVLEAHGVTTNAYLFSAMRYLFRLGKKEGQTRERDLGAAINYLERLRRIWGSGCEVGDGSIHEWGDPVGPTFHDAIREVEGRLEVTAGPAEQVLRGLAAKLRTMEKRAKPAEKRPSPDVTEATFGVVYIDEVLNEVEADEAWKTQTDHKGGRHRAYARAVVERVLDKLKVKVDGKRPTPSLDKHPMEVASEALGPLNETQLDFAVKAEYARRGMTLPSDSEDEH